MVDSQTKGGMCLTLNIFFTGNKAHKGITFCEIGSTKDVFLEKIGPINGVVLRKLFFFRNK